MATSNQYYLKIFKMRIDVSVTSGKVQVDFTRFRRHFRMTTFEKHEGLHLCQKETIGFFSKVAIRAYAAGATRLTKTFFIYMLY